MAGIDWKCPEKLDAMANSMEEFRRRIFELESESKLAHEVASIIKNPTPIQIRFRTGKTVYLTRQEDILRAFWNLDRDLRTRAALRPVGARRARQAGQRRRCNGQGVRDCQPLARALLRSSQAYGTDGAGSPRREEGARAHGHAGQMTRPLQRGTQDEIARPADLHEAPREYLMAA